MQMTIKTRLINFWNTSKAATLTTKSLLLLRVYLGIFYLQTGLGKLGMGGGGSEFINGWMTDFLNEIVTSAAEGKGGVPDFYVSFIEGVVLPNVEVFGYLVVGGEALLGFAFLFGFSVRLAGFLGAFMALNFTLASGRGFFLPSFDALLTYTLLTLAFAQAGRTFGVDVFLAKWKPKSWLW